MKAIVLAGGFGTRIQPLTNSVPKPMLPILNRPMMEHIIIKLRDELNVKEFVVLLYFKPDVIKDYFKDGSDLGIKIDYILPDDDYGTAGAVGFARELLDETFIIVSGDLVTDFDFTKIEKFHNEKKSKLTITLTPVENPLQFGVVIANDNGEIEKFLEKPSWGEVFSDTINTGIYVLEPEVFDYIPANENFDFAKDLFPKLMSEGITLWGCSVEGYWRDVGNPISYREVYEDIFSGKITLPIKGKKQEYKSGVAYVEKGTKIPEDVTVKGLVVLGQNVKVEEKVVLNNVVVGNNTTIETGTKIDSCTLWDFNEVGQKSILTSCVVCNDNKLDKKVSAKNGVIIAEKCEIGKLASFEKDVIVWPEKVIDEGAIISNNVIWGTKYKASIFEAGAVVGRTNIELSCEMATKLAESFGSILPVGSKVYISRDYHKSSRMLKRAFLGGMLSAGVNVVDLQNVPSNVMRYNLSKNEDIVAGIHFRQSVVNQIDTEILFYTTEGMEIGTNLAKSVERIFFRENFRRVNYNEIGEILSQEDVKHNYIESVKNKLNKQLFKSSEPKVVVDIMFGSTSDIYPKIANELYIENMVLNAYHDDKRLTKLSTLIKQSGENICKIVKTMELDCGMLIFPNGQRLKMVSDKGEVLDDHTLLLAVLKLMDMTTSSHTRVFLPAWAPDYVAFDNLEIMRGKFGNFKAKDLAGYDLIASNGHYSFTTFGLNTDAVFAGFKILELLKQTDMKLSDIVKELPNFCYRSEKVACSSELKGKMMRKFLEDSKGKKNSHVDGVKIWINDNEWILMVPDMHSEFLNIYLQASSKKSAEKIFADYNKKIQEWISE